MTKIKDHHEWCVDRDGDVWRGGTMTDRIEVDSVVLSCAVRYALGRHSYMPGLVIDEVRRCWPWLGEQRAVIRDDIERWLVSCDEQLELMRSDALRAGACEQWHDLAVWIDHQRSEGNR